MVSREGVEARSEQAGGDHHDRWLADQQILFVRSRLVRRMRARAHQPSGAGGSMAYPRDALDVIQPAEHAARSVGNVSALQESTTCSAAQRDLEHDLP